MTKQKYLLLLVLITITSPALASGFVIDPANIFKVWYEANHWAGITAAALFLAMVTATWKMPPVQNETKAQMTADLFRMGRYVVGILLIIEYWDMITLLWIGIVEFGSMIIDYIFG